MRLPESPVSYDNCMNVIYWDGLSPVPNRIQRHVAAIGNFDGVHRGHARLLDQLVILKSLKHCPSLVITFDPPPSAVLRPEIHIEPLTTIPQRMCLIERHGGIDTILVLQTSPQLLELSALGFWNELLCNQLAVQGLVEGRNFFFGKDRTGNVELLSGLASAKGVPLDIVENVVVDGNQVSSTTIRMALRNGEVHLARHWLGRCYSISGTVVHGEHRGQSIGFPTCNLADIATLIPHDGVYAAIAHFNGDRLPAAVNLGPNPTFGQQARKVEAHLINFSGDLYGKTVELAFVERLRNTVRFGSLAELQQQLRVDVEQTRHITQMEIESTNHG